MSKEKIIAEIISLILSPLVILVPVPFFLVYEKTGDFPLAFFWTILSTVFILLFFGFVLIGIHFKFFSDLNISKREQRPALFSFGILLTSIYAACLYLFHAPHVLILGTIAIASGLVVLGLVNAFTKVSGHLSVLSAFLTFLVLAEGPLFLVSFVLIPLLAWARIKTKNHTLFQTVLGTLVGALTTIVIYVIFKYIGKYA
jgi:hypothetical protein